MGLVGAGSPDELTGCPGSRFTERSGAARAAD
jgi:hypothetical protein